MAFTWHATRTITVGGSKIARHPLATHPISTSPETVLPIPLRTGSAPPLEGALLTYPFRWLKVDVDDSPCECGAGVAEDQAEAPGVHSRWEFH